MLYTIFAYENSIRRPENERWTRERLERNYGNYIEWFNN